ncbi:MFS transporter [Celerinatantimonas sp. MCCC 1A17872]|uniref:MFS transporter n=1 Tax=Celerinatantimonas sp. MCCC 1A17872 TaxID=3177514 RepID=UPI0038C7EE95
MTEIAELNSATYPTISRKLLIGLSAGAGFSVASIYYNQPLVSVLAQTFHLNVNQVGLIPTLTQIGYALGILLLVPLGDSVDRKKLIIAKSFMLALSLALCALSHSFGSLLLISLGIGVLATTAQDIVPATAVLANPAQRGKTVGSVMTGLLLGILLSRVFSGVMGEYLGWRSVFVGSALLVALLGCYLCKVMPELKPESRLSYPQVMASLWPLWRNYPRLRQAALAQGALSVAFSAFWSVLAIYLSDHYSLGSAAAGAFGLAGAAGAIAAPLAGARADRIGAPKVILVSIGIVILSFLGMSFALILPLHWQLLVLIICVITFDFGLNATLISHQSIIYSLHEHSRGRLNSLLFTCVFIAMALGSSIGSYAYMHWHWIGVIVLALISSVIALLIRFVKTDASHAAL